MNQQDLCTGQTNRAIQLDANITELKTHPTKSTPKDLMLVQRSTNKVLTEELVKDKDNE